ncbi:citrate synthase [Nitratireductor sp. DP7N14-4]|nr:citrate synthase [Nitratireductor sp. DP7N14-4]
METEARFFPGLEGVVATETKISFLDTQQGKIIIQGYDLIELSKSKSYLDMIYLLLEERLPNNNEKKLVEEFLKGAYDIPDELLDVFRLLPNGTHPMDGLRTGISFLSGFDTRLDDRSLSVNKSRAYKLLGKVPAIVANSYRLIEKKEPIRPLKELSYSANFFYMITGKKPSSLEEQIFDRSLVLYSEHEMPNSTFTARVISSTQSDLYGALTGAVASLKGNLHGGANEAVMEMLLEAGTVDKFEELLAAKLYKKERIMGFGHRVYMNKIDPRALMMKESLKQLCDLQRDDRLYRMCEAGEELMKREKGLYPNLDYYAAPVYWMLGIPISLYTPIFFSARTVGLCAHVIEQHEHNRLFRPRVQYVGERRF